jgi:hypothetical protein
VNALPQPVETPQQAARRLAAKPLSEGYSPDALHVYRDAQGTPLYWRIRLKHPSQPKWIRPMHWNGSVYVLGEPPAPPEGKPLYGLDRLAAHPDVSVYVVEGEACADALNDLGRVAITSGGKDSVAAADWSPMHGRDSILWPDNDPAGAVYANAVLEKLPGARLIHPDTTRALPPKGDVVDWLAQHPGATGADVDALPCIDADTYKAEPGRGATAKQCSAPEPLRRPVRPPTPYPVVELGPVLAPACQSLQRVIQAPDAICAASLLAAASLAVQGLADVEMDGRVHPLSLWFLTVAESGERKSAVDGEAMRCARDVERELAKSYIDALTAHDIELEAWNASKTEAKKKKPAQLADSLRALGPEPLPPLRPNLIAGDFTAEGLAKLLAMGRPSLGAFTDEAALVFGGHGMTKETVARTAATLCKLWDRGELDRIRAGDGATKLWGRRLALHLMAQPVIAERALCDPILRGQGFLARCLLAWPHSTAGNRPYRAESLRDDPALGHYGARLGDLLRRSLPLAEGERNELAPPTLTLTPEAKAIWQRAHDGIEAAMGPEGRYAMVKPWASKAAEQVLRVAGVLTLTEDPQAQRIEAVTIERAAELVIWHLGEAERLAGTAEVGDDIRDAEALLAWCHDTGRPLLYSRDALHKGPNRVRDAATFRRAASVLEATGWAEPIEGGAHLDGRHRRYVWRIAPASTGD